MFGPSANRKSFTEANVTFAKISTHVSLFAVTFNCSRTPNSAHKGSQPGPGTGIKGWLFGTAVLQNFVSQARFKARKAGDCLVLSESGLALTFILREKKVWGLQGEAVAPQGQPRQYSWLQALLELARV